MSVRIATSGLLDSPHLEVAISELGPLHLPESDSPRAPGFAVHGAIICPIDDGPLVHIKSNPRAFFDERDLMHGRTRHFDPTRSLADNLFPGILSQTSHFTIGSGEETRRVEGFRARSYDVPRGCAVSYFPETNALVAAGHYAKKSFTPAYKSVVISLAPS